MTPSFSPLSSAVLLALAAPAIAHADDAGDNPRQRQRDERDERELPRDDEHHRADSDHCEKRLNQLRERLLERGLDVVDVVRDTREDIAALARNIAVVATYWLNFQRIRTTPAADGADSDYLALGVYQVLALVAPFLNGDAQRLLRQLSLEYLS